MKRIVNRINMSNLTNSLFLLLFFALPFSLFSQASLSPTQLQEDFIQFKDELKKQNKGLYLFTTEEEYAQHLNDIEAQLNVEMSSLEFMKLLKKAITPIGERHLSVTGFHKKSDIVKKSKGFEGDTIKVFPLRLDFLNDSLAYIIRDARKDSSIHLPSQILSINGRSIHDLRNEMAQYITQDKGVVVWKNWELSRRFALSYFYDIDTTSTFEVEWVEPSGEKMKDEIKGVTLKQYRDSISAQTKEIYDVEDLKDIWRYEINDSLSIGYLRIGTFSSNKTKNGDKKLKFKVIVKEFFEQVEEENVASVVIDLRNNNGGSVSLVKYLYSFIQPSNEKQVVYNRLKDRDWWFGEVVREGITNRQRKPNFNGKTYVMTNEGSYSAAVMFPVIAKRFANATIVGAGPGGRPNGTSAGSFHNERLKHSDIIVRIPESVFTYTEDQNFSVQPDVVLEKKIEDYFDVDADYMLETLYQLISNEH